MRVRLFLPPAIGLALACASGPEVVEPAAAPQGTGLAFEGLYVDPGEQSTTYVRFYADGQVSSIGSTGTAEQVAAWIGRSHDGCCQGTYALEGTALTFSCTSAYGSVDHTGELRDGALHLRLYSRINGAEGEGVHAFVPVDFGAE